MMVMEWMVKQVLTPQAYEIKGLPTQKVEKRK
jgi:hypothetical protein